MKIKALVAATVLAVSGTANAAIDAADSSDAIGYLVNSEMTLQIYDKVNDLSFIQDLNVHAQDVMAAGGNYSASFGLDAAALSIFANSNASDLTWSMSAANFDLYNAPELIGNIVTAIDPVALEYAPTDGIGQKWGQMATVANSAGIADGAGFSAGTGSLLSSRVGSYNKKITGLVGFQNGATVDTSLNLYFIHLNEGYDTGAADLASSVAWSLDLSDLNNATLSNVSAVPVPAAAWLLATALFGMGGIARRRKA